MPSTDTEERGLPVADYPDAKQLRPTHGICVECGEERWELDPGEVEEALDGGMPYCPNDGGHAVDVEAHRSKPQNSPDAQLIGAAVVAGAAGGPAWLNLTEVDADHYNRYARTFQYRLEIP